jgi:Trk K+ transport system NAD-binding subunit
MKKNKDLEYYQNECERLRTQLNYKLLQTDPITVSAASKEDQRLYRKVGKKFVPVNDPYAYDGLREGFWLIHIKEGSTSIRQQIYPEKSAITAAARLMEEKLIDIIRKASEARPAKASLTPELKKDWDKFIAKHGDSFNTLCYPSMQENAEKIVAALIDNK